MKNRIFENILVGLIIIFLSAHLFTVHSKLLFHINPDKLVEKLEYYFNITLFNQELIVSTIGSIAYSLITALMLTVFVRYKKVFIFTVGAFAILDGVGVFVYYNVTIGQKIFLITGAVYYAIYTASIIIALGLFRYLNYKSDEYLDKETDKAIKEFDIMNLRDVMQEIFKENIQEYSKQNIKEPENIHGAKRASQLLDNSEVLDEKILHLSREKHLTQVEIAERLGISQPQVSRILAKYKTSGSSV